MFEDYVGLPCSDSENPGITRAPKVRERTRVCCVCSVIDRRAPLGPLNWFSAILVPSAKIPTVN